MTLTKLWTVGVKVANMEREIAFHKEIGNAIVLDEKITYDGQSFQMVLVKMGDKYLHLTQKLVYERALGETRPVGSTHMVYITDSFDQDIAGTLKAGATMIGEVATVSGGFGTRKIGFFKAPGGWFFEIFEMIQNLVPEV